jgi:secondary thiamine-phosphate synthase enzyme
LPTPSAPLVTLPTPLPVPADPSPAPLRQTLRGLSLHTSGEGFTDITAALNREIGASGLASGLAVLAVLHTSCSLTVNENADPRVLEDLAAFLRALVPPEGMALPGGRGAPRPWRHDDEGPDDMPAHIRTALTATSLSLSFRGGRLLLGTWQAVYLWEHRARPHVRQLSLHLLGA